MRPAYILLELPKRVVFATSDPRVEPPYLETSRNRSYVADVKLSKPVCRLIFDQSCSVSVSQREAGSASRASVTTYLLLVAFPEFVAILRIPPFHPSSKVQRIVLEEQKLSEMASPGLAQEGPLFNNAGPILNQALHQHIAGGLHYQ
jgi:hypothetical protein